MIRGLLIDMDGVLTQDRACVSGAPAAVVELRLREVPFRCLTNATLCPRAELAARLSRLGLALESTDVLTPAVLAARRLARHGQPSVRLFACEGLEEDLGGARLISRGVPEVVLLGDLGRSFDYEVLQEIFDLVRAGAQLWALHKAAFWEKDGRLRLDLGPFVAALEFASGRPAVVLGKPAAEAFHEAAADLGLDPSEVVMVGDDVRSDVGAAQAAGLRGVLVRTGKFREDLVRDSGIEPDAILDSVADLPAWLERAR